MSLPKAWALGDDNQSGASSNYVVKGVPKRRNSDGTYTYGSTVTLIDHSSTALNSGAQSEGAAQDNDTDDFDEVDCFIEGTLGTGTGGVISIFLLHADSSANFPSDPRSGENVHAFTPGETAPPLNFVI